jgi:hypothetical protein
MKIRVALTVMLLLVSVGAVLNGTMASGATLHLTGILSSTSVGSVAPSTTLNLPSARTSATFVQPTQSITLSQPETSYTFSQTIAIPTIPPSTFFTVRQKSTAFSTATSSSTTTIVLTTSTTVSTDNGGYSCNYWNGCYYATTCSYYGCYYSNCYYNCYNQPPTNCYPGYPGYPYCSPNYGYPGATITTATAYSLLTETSTATQTTVSTPNPIFITNTLTTTTATTDTTMETLYGSLMAIFLVLFLATLFLLVRPRTKSKGDPMPAQSQPAYVKTSYKCSACGNEVRPQMKFCGDCGTQLKHEAHTK